MDIYNILSSKEHNEHYLKRYVKFINSRSGLAGVQHHICPKAKDMFPEYKSFRQHPWNKSILTEREHYIAHLLLYKAFPNSSQVRSFYMMSTIGNIKTNSKLYEQAKRNHKKIMFEYNPMINPESRKKCSQPGIMNGMFGKPGPNLGKRGQNNPLFGRKRPEHSKKLMGRKNPIKHMIKCDHCNKIVDERNYGRWHGERCKQSLNSQQDSLIVNSAI